MRLAMTLLGIVMLCGNLIDSAVIEALRDGSLWYGNVDGMFLLRTGYEAIGSVAGLIMVSWHVRQSRCEEHVRVFTQGASIGKELLRRYAAADDRAIDLQTH